jgi:hypothetical protein
MATDPHGGDPVIVAAEPKIRRRVGELLARNHLPGAAVGVVRNGRLAWWHGFGFANLEEERRPDADTVYRVASISKTFTATAIVQLRDRGLLGLDDPLVTHIPELAAVRVHFGTLEQVTLRRLLTHRSGLISEGQFSFWDSRQFPEMAEILAKLPETEVVLAPDAGLSRMSWCRACRSKVWLLSRFNHVLAPDGCGSGRQYTPPRSNTRPTASSSLTLPSIASTAMPPTRSTRSGRTSASWRSRKGRQIASSDGLGRRSPWPVGLAPGKQWVMAAM